MEYISLVHFLEAVRCSAFGVVMLLADQSSNGHYAQGRPGVLEIVPPPPPVFSPG